MMKSGKGVFSKFLWFQVIAYVTDPPYLLAVSWCSHILTFHNQNSGSAPVDFVWDCDGLRSAEAGLPRVSSVFRC